MPAKSKLSDQERFWQYVPSRPEGGCWEWEGSRDGNGYGMFRIGAKTHRTHRLSYEFAHKTKVPEGLVVRHRCDNPPCSNPNHLELGTHADNVRDRDERNRWRRGRGNTKIFQEQRDTIRKQYLAGRTTSQLAEAHKISQQHVWKIVRDICRHKKGQLNPAIEAKILELAGLGLSQSRVAANVDLDQSTICRFLKRARG